MTTVEITLDAEATGRVIAAVPETPPAYAHGGLPPEPAHVEDLRITLRLPARCVSKLDTRGFVTVDVTALVSDADLTACEDAVIEASEND